MAMVQAIQKLRLDGHAFTCGAVSREDVGARAMAGQDQSKSDPLTLEFVDRLIIEQYERHDTQVALVRRLLTKGESITEAMLELTEVERNLVRLRQVQSFLLASELGP